MTKELEIRRAFLSSYVAQVDAAHPDLASHVQYDNGVGTGHRCQQAIRGSRVQLIVLIVAVRKYTL